MFIIDVIILVHDNKTHTLLYLYYNDNDVVNKYFNIQNH